jgi:sporulation protein YlmC with PRC-barrel domain
MALDDASTRLPSGSIDLVLRLLDHQIVGPDDQLLGNVDDLELVEDHGRLLVTGLMVGPASLGGRLPGKLGDWTLAIWRRLHPEPDPRPVVVPLEQVTHIASAVAVDEEAASNLLGAAGFELWLRRYVISRIPGATGGGEEDEPSASKPPSLKDAERALAPRRDGRPASQLIGAHVVTPEGGELGLVSELRGTGVTEARPSTIEVTHLHHSARRVGSGLGYGQEARQGPLLVSALIRRWQRHDRVVPWADVIAIDWATKSVTVARHTGHRHPHAEA